MTPYDRPCSAGRFAETAERFFLALDDSIAKALRDNAIATDEVLPRFPYVHLLSRDWRRVFLEDFYPRDIRLPFHSPNDLPDSYFIKRPVFQRD